VESVVETAAQTEAEPSQPDHSALAEVHARAEQETAILRAETESRRRAAEREQQARVEAEENRRKSMEDELARVEAEMRGAVPKDDAAQDEQVESDRYSPVVAAVVRGVLPLLESLNRRFKLKWDGKLAKLRKRL
jgi:hypothetical protein